jgi:hypothetical protein
VDSTANGNLQRPLHEGRPPKSKSELTGAFPGGGESSPTSRELKALYESKTGPSGDSDVAGYAHVEALGAFGASASEVLLHSHAASTGAAIACLVSV